jgi:hypothetical protein
MPSSLGSTASSADGVRALDKEKSTHQHEKIEVGRGCKFIASVQDAFEDKNCAGSTRSVCAPAQDRDRLLIWPIVKHVRQYVGVSICWQGIEEASGHDRCPRR